MKPHQYQAQLQSEAFTIIKSGILWATYVSCVLAFVVLINTYYVDSDDFKIVTLHAKFLPLLITIGMGLGLVRGKACALSQISVKQAYFYLILLIVSWCYLLISLASLAEQNMRGIESLADILVLVFALALFPNRNVMLLGILPFLLFSTSYYGFHYSTDVIYPISKFLCFLGILISGQKIISGWFFKSVVRDIEKKKLLQQFKRLALIDGLTNISNRRHFDEVLSQEVQESIRNSQPLTVIMVDVDFFKQLNDSLGHLEGDHYLIKVAHLIGCAVERPRDFVARYGGEEFVLVLPDTDVIGATRVAQKIKQQFSEAGLVHPSSKISDCITVSQGIAQWQVGEQQSQLLARADRLLYQAKSAGRDGYCAG